MQLYNKSIKNRLSEREGRGERGGKGERELRILSRRKRENEKGGD